MRSPLKSLDTMLSNTKIEMHLDGWPAATAVLGVCGCVAFTAYVCRKDDDREGGEDDDD